MLRSTLAILCLFISFSAFSLTLYSDQKMDEMGRKAYADLKRKIPQEKDPNINAYVDCVTKALLKGSNIKGSWEVTVFKDKSANAFALPGRKIGVNTGMLRVAKNQSQLAAVLGHEIAHVLEKHANERVSTQTATQIGLNLLQIIGGSSAGNRQLYGLLGVGAQYGILLPFSRSQESQADEYGLAIMSRAGFDPRQSVELWKNMQKASQGRPVEFLQTHPSPNTRIKDLEYNMPRAIKLSEAANAKGLKPACKM